MPTFLTISRTFCSLLSFFRSLSIFRAREAPAPAESPKPNTAPVEPSAAIKNLEGQVIGSYNLISELDRGTFAAVYYCKHIVTQRFYAAKVYSPQWIRTKTGKQTIHEELTVIKLLNHRNTTFFQDVIFTSNGVMIVMELVEGKTLLDILPARDGVMEYFARHIFLQFLDGLEYLHQSGILHRDIKLENVMIDFEGNIKIIDYGMAKFIPRCKTPENLLVTDRCGSKNYFAPEIYSNTKTTTGFRGDKTDIWTSGVLLFCLVIGTFPFHHDKEEEMEKLILNCESWIKYWTKSDRRVSPELKDLFRKIFVKDPVKRPSATELKAHPWTTGTKLRLTNERRSVFTSTSGKVSVSFTHRKIDRSLSWDMESSRTASLESQKDSTRKANTDGSCSPLANYFHEPNIEEVENAPRTYETVSIASESAQSRRKKLGRILRAICETPKRICTKNRARKEEGNQDKRDRNQPRVQDRRGREHDQDAEGRHATSARARKIRGKEKFVERKRRRTGTPARFWSRRDSRKPIATASVSRLRKNAGLPPL